MSSQEDAHTLTTDLMRRQQALKIPDDPTWVSDSYAIGRNGTGHYTSSADN